MIYVNVLVQLLQEGKNVALGPDLFRARRGMCQVEHSTTNVRTSRGPYNVVGNSNRR